MKRHYEDNGALELDVLYESEDPAVQAALVEFMQEEMAAAQERNDSVCAQVPAFAVSGDAGAA